MRYFFFDLIEHFGQKFIYFEFSFFGYLEAAPEAVKRKAVEETDAVEAADETAPTPEKKSKVEEAAHENGAAEEVVA